MNSPGRNEALLQRVGEALGPQRTLLRQLGLSEGTRDALMHRGDRSLITLRVFFQQHFFADGLSGKVGRGMNGVVGDVLHGCQVTAMTLERV